MSDSPADDTFDDPKLPDELDEGAQHAGNSDTGLATTPAKRGRGRPKGSKNKKSAAGTAASTSEVAPAAGEKRRRGRPPKVCLEPIASGFPFSPLVIVQPKNPQEETATGEPPAKRKRGRPPKTPKPVPPHDDVAEGATSDPPPKRKRGRPPKNAA
ncbi:hypothetical protein BJV78DRAFT_1150697 [Lactifluus subvellereus]|nr:hypothetical protein BJV78DRAFT_1150697 [Lactifluus subvellereus]